MGDLRTPLARVKGLGSAKDGTHHFWHQRLTALLLVPLALWIGFCIASLPRPCRAWRADRHRRHRR